MQDRSLLKSPSGCRVCGARVEPAFVAREMMLGLRDAFEYVECIECGCLQIASLPDDMDRYYGDAYYTHTQSAKGRARDVLPVGGSERSRGVRIGRALRRFRTRIRLRAGTPGRLLPGRRHGRIGWIRRTETDLDDRILDVGCGSGRLLWRLHAMGFDRLTGIDERLETSGRSIAGLRFECVSLEHHEGRYRLVMAHHSFEHMRDPVAAFSAFGRLVEPGGHLVLRTPRADGWARRHYAADWVQLDAPRHLHLHTRRSLERLAADAGFRVIDEVDDSGPFQIWGSELYRRGIPLVDAGPGGRRILGVAERLAARVEARRLSRAGLGDQACFYFRKIG